MPKNFISINDFSKKQIFEEILPQCEGRIEFVKSREIIQRKNDAKVTFAFFEPSTRTLGSYYEASQLLGFRSDKVVGEDFTSIKKKESMANTARMYANQNADVIVIRTKIEGAPRFISEILEEEGYNVSVQNGGDGTNQHPTQTFLDLLTIKKHLGRLEKFKIGFFGDLKYGRTIHSLLCALSHQKNVSVVLASDPETALQDQYKSLFRDVQIGDSLETLVDCDLNYGGRLQEERFAGDPIALQRARGRFKITRKVLDDWKKDVIIMHPLPYTVEITPEVRRDKRIIVDDQAWCGLPTRVHLLQDGYTSRICKAVKNGERGKLKILKQVTLSKYLEQRSEKKAYQYFVPIQNGIVIDHIPNGLGLKIRGFISSFLGGKYVRHLIEDVDSGKMGGCKDVIVVEGGFLTKEQMISVCSLNPTITINDIREGVFAKFKIDTPSVVSGIGRCPNQNCITNNDPEAKYKFSSIGGGVKCVYCEKHFTTEEVLV